MIMKKNTVTNLAVIALMIAVSLVFGRGTATAQSGSMNNFPGVDTSVNALVNYPDGRVLLGGTFSQVGSQARNNLARVNADNTVDANFNPNPNSYVYKVLLQPDGKILVSGNFSQIGGQNRNGLARLNADGSVDTTFSPTATGALGVLQPDGKIIVYIDSFSPSVPASFVRLNPNGTVDNSFKTTKSYGGVRTVALQADGKILTGSEGASRYSSGTSVEFNRINTDGSPDITVDFNGKYEVITKIVVQPDGKILLGGTRSSSAPATLDRALLRLNADGSVDSTFANVAVTGGGEGGFSGRPTVYGVDDIALQPGGKILLGGTFNTVNGQSKSNFARVNADGTLDTAFNSSANRGVDKITLRANGNIIIAGIFSAVNGIATNNPAELTSSGELVNAAPQGPNGEVKSIAVQPDGKILVGGSFTQINGQNTTGLVRLNSDKTIDNTFTDPNIKGGDPRLSTGVTQIYVQPDGKILIGGSFVSVSNKSRDGFARLNADGTLDAGFNPPSNIGTFALQADGKILYGSFSQIKRLNADGSADSTFTGATFRYKGLGSSSLGLIKLQSDGKILIAGGFDTINGQPRNDLARLNADGSLDSSFVPPTKAPGLNDSSISKVAAVAVQANGKIIIAAYYQYGQGSADNNPLTLRLNANGSVDNTFNAPSFQDVKGFVLQSDGKVIAYGFSPGLSSDDKNAQGIARLNTDGSRDTTFIPNAYRVTVNTATLQKQGDIIVGGDFTFFGGQNVKNLAFVTNNTPASQTLDIKQNSITWTLSGSTPAPSRVTFEGSLDGTNYNPAVPATGSIVNNTVVFALTGLNLPTGQKVCIRARGFYDNGNSESILETVQNVTLINTPPPATTVSVSGKVTVRNIGVPFAVVTISNAQGQSATTKTDVYGNYTFNGVPVGQTYTFKVSGTAFKFNPQTVKVTAAIKNLNFQATGY